MAAPALNPGPFAQPFWDWRAAGNFLCGGAGSGMLLTAAAAAATGLDARAALFAGTVLVMTGLALVWTELGRPWRFLNVFRNTRSSWMSLESWAAILLTGSGLLAAATASMAAIVAAAAAAASFLYCQARILRAGRAIAAWRTPAIVPLIVVTGVAEGAALVLALPWTLHGARPPLLLPIVLALCLTRALAWYRYRHAVGDDAPRATLQALAGSHLPMVVFGTLLPVLLLLAAYITGPAGPALATAAGIAIWLSGWALKFVIVTEAACTQGFALPHSPARGAGRAGPGARPGWGPAG